jgi:hypothetical protein
VKARSGNATKTAEELRDEINLRLKNEGHDIIVGLPRFCAGLHTAGRNWELELPPDLTANAREADLTILRLVGDEFDCSWGQRSWAVGNP